MVMMLVRMLALLPLPVLHGLGRFVGRCIYAMPGRYRNRLRANARQAGYSDPGFARRAAAESGAMIMETAKVWMRTDECLQRVSTDQEHVVQQALAEGRGILYLTPHLGCFEITARYMVKYGPLTVMYRPPRHAALEPAMEQARNIPGLRAVPATTQGVREFVRALKRGEAVGMLPDQVPGAGDGVWAPFFGRPALTMTLAGKLARQTGVAVIMLAGERLPRGKGWRMHFLRLPEPLPDDPVALASLINTSMEALIKRFPEQYLWSYNRYKIPSDAPPLPDSFAQ
ncbi:MAG TPA: lysophospholipid acyltransferase family protein [Burkholderiaceae bacterium]|nr:lysophospholipid acyltransferase family protein [Burkholderiaceae bacterium]